MAGIAAGLVLGAIGPVAHAANGPAAPSDRSLTSWAPSVIDGASDPYLTAGFPLGGPRNQSVRMVARVSAPGSALRIRLSNRFGRGPVRFGPVRVGLSKGGPNVMPGSSRLVLFAGRPTVTIPPGADARSDVVAFPLSAGTQVAVSVHVSRSPLVVTWHRYANALSYVSPPGSGDLTGADMGAGYTTTTTAWFWLSGIEQQSDYRGTVVALGDSITDGWPVAPDQYQTWPDVLADRLAAAPFAERRAVVNAGIASNEVRGAYSCPLCGEPAVLRVGHDALDLVGVRDLIMFEGTNDLGSRASADDVIAGLARVAAMAHRAGIRVYGATITPRSDSGWTPTMEAARERVNAWVRTSRVDDGYFDFDAVLRSPLNRHELASEYDSGDHLHPNFLGLRALGESIDLTVFA